MGSVDERQNLPDFEACQTAGCKLLAVLFIACSKRSANSPIPFMRSPFALGIGSTIFRSEFPLLALPGPPVVSALTQGVN